MSIALIGIIVILAITIFVLIKLRDKFKRLKTSNVTLITGAVKTGKTWLAVKLAIKTYKKNLFLWYLLYPINKIKEKIQSKLKDGYKVPSKPVLYSNIPLRNVKFVLIDDIRLFMRECRLPLDSVVLLDEVSLIADSLMIYSYDFNEKLKLFIKLFCHQNGNRSALYLTTQSLDDCHFTFKRSLGTFLFIYRTIKFPFISLMKVREMVSINGESLNVSGNDFEETCLNYLIGNRYHKYYDSRCFSSLTDNKPLYDKQPIKLKLRDVAKAETILSLHNTYLDLYQAQLNKKSRRLNDERK